MIMKETERGREGGITTTVSFTCNDLVSIVFTTVAGEKETSGQMI